MFSFFKKSVVSQPDTALALDFGMLGTEKQQKLVDCTHTVSYTHLTLPTIYSV